MAGHDDKNDHHRPPLSKAPDTYLILLAVALLAFAASWFIPAGSFEVDADGKIIGGFTYAPESGGLPIFADDGGPGLLNFLFDGLVSGDRNGAAVGLIAFVLIVGGTFGVVLRTGVVEQALNNVLGGERASDLLIPALFVGFSLCGAVFGMSEEAIVFAFIVIPALIRSGYDSITGLIVTYVATQVGFATSWMNPFGVVIAQGIAGVPPLSGLEYRVAMWCVFTAFGALFALRYAMKVRHAPERSVAYTSDGWFRAQSPVHEGKAPLGVGHWLILGGLVLTIVWVAWGVVTKAYYLPEISAQFFALGLFAGMVAVVFRVGGMTANQAVEGFKQGAMNLVPAAIVIGIAKGIVLLLGGDDPGTPSTLNTILHGMSGLTGGVADWFTAWLMYLLQSTINLFVVSGSGQAALTMPLMTPLADLSGVSRQTAVLAFQLGDGLTNIICPASAALMGCLGAARLDWTVWAGFIWKLQLYLMALASGFVILSVLIGYS